MDLLLNANQVLIANFVIQKIKNLKPGRLYSLKVFTADYGDLTGGKSLKQKHSVSIKLDDAEIVKSFRHIYANCYSHHLEPFDNKHKFWMHYHFMVFRPGASSSRLEVSDWVGDEPGGPIGQELMYNFIEIQPYISGKPKRF